MHRQLGRLHGSSLRVRLTRGVVWSLLGGIITRGLGLLSSVIIARILGKATFGELGIFQSTVGMFQSFGGFALGMTATKYVAELRSVDTARTGRIIVLSNLFAVGSGGLVGLLLFGFAPWLAARTLAAPQLTDLLRIGSLTILFGALTGAQTGTLAGFESFKAITKINLVAGILTFPLVISATYWLGLRGAAWGLAASIAVNWCFMHTAVRAEARGANIPLRIKDCLREWKVFFAFSLPAVLAGFMLAPVTWACNVMLVNQPEGYAEMGLLNVANQWRAAILFLPAVIEPIVLPLLANLRSVDDNARYVKVLWSNILLSGLIALTGALGVTLASRSIMLIYGKEFLTGVDVLILLSFSAVLVALNNVVGQAIASQGKMWNGLLLNALWAVALLTGAYLLIPSFGAKGLAWALIVAYSLHSLWQSWYLRRCIVK